MNEWKICAEFIDITNNACGLFICVFCDVTYNFLPGNEWVLSQHPGWRSALTSFFVIGLIRSIYSVWKSQE